MGEAVHENTPATWDFLMDLNARTLMKGECGGPRHVRSPRQDRDRGRGRRGEGRRSHGRVLRLQECADPPGGGDVGGAQGQGHHVNYMLPSIIDTPDNRAAMRTRMRTRRGGYPPSRSRMRSPSSHPTVLPRSTGEAIPVAGLAG